MQVADVECEVHHHHLHTLGRVQALLTTLNDRYAGGAEVAPLVEQIAVLAARCVRRAERQRPDVRVRSVAHALAVIGNRGLEGEILDLLEALTVLKAEAS